MSGEQVSGEQMSSEHISLVGEQMSSGSLTGEQVSDEHLSVGEHLSSEQMSYLRFRVSKCLVSKCHGILQRLQLTSSKACDRNVRVINH